MTSNLHALVFIHNWGDNNELLQILKNSGNVISLFHIMGKSSYLIDANFDNKAQLEEWINHIKTIRVFSVPAVISIETQKIIDSVKQKEDFNLNDYKNLTEKFHFFVKIDNPHHDERLISMLKNDPIVHSVLHVQGECSFIAEVITDDYDLYKYLLKNMKTLESIHHIETQEVISVIKYRNQIIDESGNLVFPKKDNREIYML